jgi:hypothetical protein
MMHCNCEVLCKGGKNVSRKTYLRHSKYRNEFSPEFIAFMAAASNDLEEVSIISIRASAIIYNFVTMNRMDSESLLMTTTWTLVDYSTEMKAPRM